MEIFFKEKKISQNIKEINKKVEKKSNNRL